MNRFEPDHTCTVRIEKQAEFRRGMRTRAKVGVEFVVALSPERTGYYRRHVKARGNRIHATDPFWHIVEWGSVKSAPYAPLRRGVIAAGFRFEPSPAPL